MSAAVAEPEAAPILHNITPDGRLMHSMRKVDGVWCCPCGERRDRFGKPLLQESP